MENVSAVTLVRSIRRMHAHVVIAANGHRYFVKSPLPDYCEGRAVMGAKIAAVCGVKTVEPAQVIFDEEFVARFASSNAPEFDGYTPSLHAGTFFGTRFPTNPDCTAIWDMLPVKSAMQIRNPLDFSIMRTADCWIANARSGRAIFVRQPEKDLVAYMLGFGRCFSFAETELPRSWNWSFAPLVSPACWEKAVDTIEVIRRITKSNLEEMMSEIPSDWWRGIGPSAPQIIETLLSRQSKVGQMLMELRRRETGLPTRKSVHVETVLGLARRSSA